MDLISVVKTAVISAIMTSPKTIMPTIQAVRWLLWAFSWVIAFSAERWSGLGCVRTSERSRVMRSAGTPRPSARSATVGLVARASIRFWSSSSSARNRLRTSSASSGVSWRSSWGIAVEILREAARQGFCIGAQILSATVVLERRLESALGTQTTAYRQFAGTNPGQLAD